MLDAKAREILEGASRVLGTAVGRTGVHPNTLTVAGVGITGVAAWQILDGHFFAAAAVLGGGSVLDFVDGAVAREMKKSTPLGAFLDSVADRVSDATVLSALFWTLFARGSHLLAALALASLVLGQLVPYIRAKAESLGYSCKVGVMERAERILVLIAGLAFGILPIVLWALAVLSGVTVAQRLVHVGRQASRRSG